MGAEPGPERAQVFVSRAARLPGGETTVAVSELRPALSLFALVQRNEMAQGRPHIYLPGTVNAALGIVLNFLVVGDPSGHAANGKNHREHFERDADGPHDDAAVKIDVRVQFTFNEIGIIPSP